MSDRPGYDQAVEHVIDTKAAGAVPPTLGRRRPRRHQRHRALVTDTIDGFRLLEVHLPRVEQITEDLLPKIEDAIEMALGPRTHDVECPLDEATKKPLYLADVWLEPES